MFRHKRSRSNPPRPGTTTPSAAATLAASQAFLANRASNANLSASAAAAALRSHTSSPTPVGEIQTKRMQRRGSVTSNGSVPSRPGGLQRRDSGGSMTDRTFREPSPSPPERPSSSHGPYPNYKEEEPPPVPALPQRYASPPPTIQHARRRPASVDPPRRTRSPPVKMEASRASVSNVAGVAPVRQTTEQGNLDTNATGEAHQAANQASSRASVNFSRPMSPQLSPEISQSGAARAESPTPIVMGMPSLPTVEAENNETSRQQVANRPLKKKKKKVMHGPERRDDLTTQKDHNALEAIKTTNAVANKTQDGGQDDKPNVIKPNTSESVVGNPNKVKRQKKRVATAHSPPSSAQDEAFGSAYPSDTDSVVSDVSSTTDRPRNVKARAAGVLGKQPSIVREDREGEAKAENRLGHGGLTTKHDYKQVPQAGPFTDSPKALLKSDVAKDSPKPLTVEQGRESLSANIRLSHQPASLSPARAAHFASNLTYDSLNGTKHQPPARSASPAKSALKLSPSRGQSPALVRSKGLGSGETSDTASAISDDSTKPDTKRKKHVRVSFDEDSVITGSPVGSDSPVMQSPQNKLHARAGFLHGRDTDVAFEDRNQEQEDLAIKPTPTLPSFGSIRGQKQKESEKSQMAEKLSADQGTESTASKNRSDGSEPASTTNSLQQIQSEGTTSLQPSSDKLLSSSEARYDIGAPISTGAKEEAESLEETHEANDLMKLRSSSAVPPVVQEPIERSAKAVPAIAVMPATPRADEKVSKEDEWLTMPGDFPGPSVLAGQQPVPSHTAEAETANDTSKMAIQAEFETQQNDSDDIATKRLSSSISPTTVGIAGPERETMAAQRKGGVAEPGAGAQSFKTQTDSHISDESADNDSVYSDAAEDQSDNEGDGFGSINAIIESPASPDFPATDQAIPLPPHSEPQKDYDQDEAPISHESGDHRLGAIERQDDGQGYWSGLSSSRKQQLEHAALPGAVDDPIVPQRTMRGKNSLARRKKKTSKTTATSTREEYAYREVKTAPQILTAETRKSPGRDFIPTGSPNPSVISQSKVHPASVAPNVDQPKPAVDPSNKHTRAASAKVSLTSNQPPANQVKTPRASKPKTGRAKSNGSNSDSSFKRIRPSAPDTGRYQMKRSMRGGVTDPSSPSAKGASSIGMRTSSPASTTGRRPFSSVGPPGGGMRKSMRGSSDLSQPSRMSLRMSMDSGKASRTKSPSRLGFGLSSKARSSEQKGASKTAKSFSSRFVDSSDDDDTLDMQSRSRFADSSDEETPDFTPVRGIPRQIDEGDSTELEDSSAENVKVPTSGKSIDTQPTSVSAPSSKIEGLALASGSLRAQSNAAPQTSSLISVAQADKVGLKERKKRSIFGVFGSKRKERLESGRPGQLGTLRDQSKASLKAEEAQPAMPSSPTCTAPKEPSVPQSSTKSPKLQRRVTPKTVATASNKGWPLAADTKKPADASAAPSRPQTSDGARASDLGPRPDLGNRRVTLQSPMMPSAAPASVGEAKSGKKKRFNMIRKAFGRA